MSEAQKELEKAVSKAAKEAALKDDNYKKRVRGMSAKEQREALDEKKREDDKKKRKALGEKIKQESASVQITAQG